ncbi:hypothetical protein [Ottowia sp.]|uniref:hypothetical protein n=1 Tax=Ottowia sp. TaxID=1898956 RepID=UPI003A8C0C82
MKLHEHVIALVEELDRVHPRGVANQQELKTFNEQLNFVTADNGKVRHFTLVAQKKLRDIVTLLYDNNPDWKTKIEHDAFHDQTRRCIANLHASGQLANPRADDAYQACQKIGDRLEQQLTDIAATFVHHIPCWTDAVSPGSDFVMGPVTFRAVDDWIDWVDFQPAAYRVGSIDEQQANKDWKGLLKTWRAAAKQNEVDGPPAGLAGDLSSALSQCPAMATVTVNGYESVLSKKVAHAVTQAALDCMSLALKTPNAFIFQIVGSTRAEPFRWTSIVGTPEGLGLPGFARTRRAIDLGSKRTRTRLANAAPLLDQGSAMLTSLLTPTSHQHPELANRWLTALQWLAEGCREQDDAIAVAKLGSALDILAAGGKAKGITTMLENFQHVSKDTPWIRGPRGELNLGQVVKAIYDSGRSQILHGTHYQRLKRFEELRELARLIVPQALIEAAMRLAVYIGPDSEATAFRTMTPPGSPPTDGSGIAIVPQP